MLNSAETILLVVDVQEKLARAMPGRDEMVHRTRQLVEGTRVLGVPALFTEQNPRGLGPTLPEIAALVPDFRPVEKTSFSCCGSAGCMQQLRHSGRRDVVVAGIETHVCVYQTVVDLLAEGFRVEVVADACASRTAENRQIGLERCRRAGAAVTSVEILLFELLKAAEGPLFKEILRIVK
jgi:nicotinamidase-related amidase